jgi:hypothetical protein
MRKLQEMASTLNEEFRDHLADAMREKFDGLEVETTANIFAMRLVTRRVDGEDFTPEQIAWLEAWSEGYGKALDRVRDEDNESRRW